MTKGIKIWSVTVLQNFNELSSGEISAILAEFSEQWCFQMERGSETGGEHYQGRMILREAMTKETLLQVLSCRVKDMRDVTVSPESNKSIEKGGLSFYVMKDFTKLDGPWMDSSYKLPKVVTYNFEDLECMKVPLEWQQRVIDHCRAPWDDRCINWVYNEKGCAGKSKLMKWMYCESDLDMARVPMGSAIQIKTSVIEKGAHKIYMVDLPRVRGGDERQQELFSALEEIKNGWVESPMYGKCAELTMLPPHVWIFSNELPNLTFASEDRWRIWELRDAKLKRWLPGAEEPALPELV